MSEQEAKRLNREFEAFAREEYERWTRANPPPTVNWYRNIADEMVANAPAVEARHEAWTKHIDPIAAAWWRERGWGQVFDGDKAFIRKINQAA